MSKAKYLFISQPNIVPVNDKETVALHEELFMPLANITSITTGDHLSSIKTCYGDEFLSVVPAHAIYSALNEAPRDAKCVGIYAKPMSELKHEKPMTFEEFKARIDEMDGDFNSLDELIDEMRNRSEEDE